MLDYLSIFAKFNEAGIQYLVAGGMAVNLHGIPRMTYDRDTGRAQDEADIKHLKRIREMY